MLRRLMFYATISLEAAGGAVAQDTGLSFFITSAGPGNGANLGGLAGADQHCTKLATAVGAGNRTWRAYLSTSASGNQPAVNARDRIGSGPWVNAKGVAVAKDADDLHSANNQLTKQNSLSEKGDVINGGGVINVYGELHRWPVERAQKKAGEIYETLLRIFEIAKQEKIPTYRAADRLAEQRIAAVAGLDRMWMGR